MFQASVSESGNWRFLYLRAKYRPITAYFQPTVLSPSFLYRRVLFAYRVPRKKGSSVDRTDRRSWYADKTRQ